MKIGVNQEPQQIKGSDSMPPHAQSKTESILIVEDHAELCETLERFFSKQGYRVVSNISDPDALERTLEDHFDLIIADVQTLGMNYLELLHRLKESGSGVEVVLTSTNADINQAVEAMLQGAAYYLPKPFELEVVAGVVRQLFSRRHTLLNTENQARGNGHNGRSASSYRADKSHQGSSTYANASDRFTTPLIERSAVMKKIHSIIERIAPTNSSVLITGATGTGKELVARAIHELSHRRNAPFIDINCSAIPETLIEAELFGHQRGTFTGAYETRRGLFEEASGGTLFLDEVDALNLSAQAKMLRVLQERRVRRVGGRENIPVDVRIISATNRNLQTAVEKGTFRTDLFFRLCVVPIHMPELRERDEDIALLAEYLLIRHTERRVEPRRRFSAEAMRALMAHRWPGNVRELENAVEYALAISRDEEIGIDSLPPNVFKSSPAEGGDVLKEWMSNNLPLADVERLYILSVLERYNGHQIKTAAALGIDRRTLYRKLQQYGEKILAGDETYVGS